jgi:enoyl-CoA hydratase/carnithine racemase
MPGTVRVERPTPEVALVTLDRPDRLNAMNHELVADLHDALEQIGTDNTCRVVVLTGEGRGFCAGLDLKGTGSVPHAQG